MSCRGVMDGALLNCLYKEGVVSLGDLILSRQLQRGLFSRQGSRNGCGVFQEDAGYVGCFRRMLACWVLCTSSCLNCAVVWERCSRWLKATAAVSEALRYSPLCSAAACLSNECGEAWCRDASMRLVQSRGGKHRPAAEAFSGATTSIMIDRITGTS